MKLRILVKIVAVLQIVLGILYLTAPQWLLNSMGHSIPQADINYPLGMLASRFLVVGVVFWIISGDLNKHALWLKAMFAIQAIDLAVGLGYSLTSVVALSISAFPMFNAALIMLLLFLWKPEQNKTQDTVTPKGITHPV
jgi:hypothetical protein